MAPMSARPDAVRSTIPRHAPLLAVVRGDHVESVHHGSIAVVDRAGRVVVRAGDPDAAMFTRSTLKPLQVLPLVASGGLEHFGLDERALALMCASHNGEPEHVRVAEQILVAAGCRADQLRCGSHTPMFYLSNGDYPPPGEIPTVLQHNCSGKHAGMLALCRLRGFDPDGYNDPGHPVQAIIRDAVAAFSGVAAPAMASGPDGCSVPNYAFPLTALAGSYARLAAAGPDPDFGGIPSRIFAAMTRHAFLISGTGRQDAALAEAGGGDWVSKIGGEGLQCLGLRSLGLGIAIKIADGDKGDYQPRATFPVALEVLRQVGALGRSPGDLPEALQRFDAASHERNEGRFRVRLETCFSLAAA